MDNPSEVKVALHYPVLLTVVGTSCELRLMSKSLLAGIVVVFDSSRSVAGRSTGRVTISRCS